MNQTNTDITQLARHIVHWQQQHGRQHLPWQHTRDPYRIWLSEIMLQQTQVATVLGYYERFLARFPTVSSLAAASQDEVMPYWAGLGYYARARNLHRCAQTIMQHYEGHFPQDSQTLAQLPGIGPSTAAAIAAFAYGERAPIMDGNVKRVFCRYFGVYGPTHLRATEKQLWALASQALEHAPADLNMAAYTQGQMDLGAQVCRRTKPNCSACPLQQGCYAFAHQAQAELPTPKPRKTIPTRYCHMLVWQQDSTIYLEQRPDEGIWGGLLSLPQFETEQQLQHYLRTHGLDTHQAQIQKMAAFEHVFSHFKLHITPWWLHTAQPTTTTVPHQLAEEGVHYATEQLQQAALPAPVAKLLSVFAVPITADAHQHATGHTEG